MYPVPTSNALNNHPSPLHLVSPTPTTDSISTTLPHIPSPRSPITPLSHPASAPAFSSTVSRTVSPNPPTPPTTHHPIPLDSVHPVIKDGKTDDVDESVMNVKLMANALKGGTEDEITLVLFETQHVLNVCRDHAIQTLLPIICDRVHTWTKSLQISAAEALLFVVASNIHPLLANRLSDTAFALIRSAPDPAVSESWGHILVKTLPHVSWTGSELDQVVDQLEHHPSHASAAASTSGAGSAGSAGSTTTTSSSSSSSSSAKFSLSRQLTARILGALAVCSKQEALKRKIMYRAMSIANDQSVEVRGMIAESMQHIAASISIKAVEEELWPCISKLIRDDDVRVHAVSLRSLSYIAMAHKDKSPHAKLFRSLIPKIFATECASIRRDAEMDQRKLPEDKYLVLEMNSEVFGAMLHSCSEFLVEDSALKEALKAYLALATCNSPAIRKHCAFNLPGVAQSLVRKYRADICGVAEFLSLDGDPETRWILAGGIHEVVRVLASPETIAPLYKSVLALLQDQNSLVRMNTLKHFEKLIAQLAKHMGYTAVGKLEPIFHNLHLLSEGNWRTQELLSRQLLLAAPLVPPPCIRSHVLPLLFKMAESGCYLVRRAAMAAVATCMRYIPDTTERDEEMASFREEWANGPVYWMRIGFIDSAKAALNLYSRCVFRDTFGSSLLKLCDDRTSNVRMRVALILPEAAPACHQMVEFQTAVSKLKKDKDKDVMEAMCNFAEKLERALKKGSEDFERDMKREEEEQELYSKHLQAQKEAFRKKKGPVKKAKTLALMMTKPRKSTLGSARSHIATPGRTNNEESQRAGGKSTSTGPRTSRPLGKKPNSTKAAEASSSIASPLSSLKTKNMLRKSRLMADSEKGTAAGSSKTEVGPSPRGTGSPPKNKPAAGPSSESKKLPKRKPGTKSFILRKNK